MLYVETYSPKKTYNCLLLNIDNACNHLGGGFLQRCQSQSAAIGLAMVKLGLMQIKKQIIGFAIQTRPKILQN